MELGYNLLNISLILNFPHCKTIETGLEYYVHYGEFSLMIYPLKHLCKVHFGLDHIVYEKNLNYYFDNFLFELNPLQFDILWTE